MKKNNQFLKIIHLETVDSTNSYAFRLAEQGAPEITVIWADHQAKGRGRYRRPWLSPKQGGIYASFILRPPNCLGQINFLPLIFSYAAAKILSDFVQPQIKWPNDLMVKGLKICGILLEARSQNEKVDFVVAGVGININSQRQDIPPGATSLYLETKNNYDLKELFQRLLKQILSVYDEFKNDNLQKLFAKLIRVCQKKSISGLSKNHSLMKRLFYQAPAFNNNEIIKDCLSLR